MTLKVIEANRAARALHRQSGFPRVRGSFPRKNATVPKDALSSCNAREFAPALAQDYDLIFPGPIFDTACGLTPPDRFVHAGEKSFAWIAPSSRNSSFALCSPSRMHSEWDSPPNFAALEREFPGHKWSVPPFIIEKVYIFKQPSRSRPQILRRPL